MDKENLLQKFLLDNWPILKEKIKPIILDRLDQLLSQVRKEGDIEKEKKILDLQNKFNKMFDK